jgi:glycosyltransferase involved in cell wall biosynthesis
MVDVAGPRRASRPLVVIPAWNEAQVITHILGELHQMGNDVTILVVDDGSTDDTALIARLAGCEVLCLPFHIGVGGAVRAGFRYAQRHGFDAVVQVDADGQHNPADVPSLLAELGRADVVIGSRFLDGPYRAPRPRRLAMWILARGLSLACRHTLTDVTSGFRATGPRALPLFSEFYPPEYLGDTVESLVIAHRAKMILSEVPVTMRHRMGGSPSQSMIQATAYLLRALLVLLLALVRSHPNVAARAGGGR